MKDDSMETFGFVMAFVFAIAVGLFPWLVGAYDIFKHIRLAWVP